MLADIRGNDVSSFRIRGNDGQLCIQFWLCKDLVYSLCHLLDLTMEGTTASVSYTHLDVYKRQD